MDMHRIGLTISFPSPSLPNSLISWFCFFFINTEMWPLYKRCETGNKINLGVGKYVMMCLLAFQSGSYLENLSLRIFLEADNSGEYNN